MLPKNERLKSKKDIDAIFKYGDSFKSSSILCKYRKNDLGISRPAFSFAKNLKLKAFQKSRLKRQLSHAYKEAIAQINLMDDNSHDMFFILMSLPDENTKRFDQFKSDFCKIISHIKCLKDS